MVRVEHPVAEVSSDVQRLRDVLVGGDGDVPPVADVGEAPVATYKGDDRSIVLVVLPVAAPDGKLTNELPAEGIVVERALLLLGGAVEAEVGVEEVEVHLPGVL